MCGGQSYYQSYRRQTHSHTDGHAQKYTHLGFRLDKPLRSVRMGGGGGGGHIELL